MPEMVTHSGIDPCVQVCPFTSLPYALLHEEWRDTPSTSLSLKQRSDQGGVHYGLSIVVVKDIPSSPPSQGGSLGTFPPSRWLTLPNDREIGSLETIKANTLSS